MLNPAFAKTVLVAGIVIVLTDVVLGLSGARAQPERRPYRIAVLNNSFTPGTPTVEGLRAGIKAEGLEEGRDVRFDVRSTGAEDRSIAPLAAALAGRIPTSSLPSAKKRREPRW